MSSERELVWWNSFADVMACHWNLTPRMNRAIRSEYERDYEAFLWTPGGAVLDVGCGTGVRTHGLARRGVKVDGIDFSESQIALARMLAREQGLTSMAFFRRDLVSDQWMGRFEQYDGVLVNALLHHLSCSEIAAVFEQLGAVLKPGGRAYIYEPVVRDPESRVRFAAFWGVDLCWRILLGAFLRAGRGLSWFDEQFREAMKRGYNGTSPDEQPLEYERLLEYANEDFEVVEFRPFHQYSLAYAMAIMLLEQTPRRHLEGFASVMYSLDQRLFRLRAWENAGTKKRWILCALKLLRR